MLRKNLGNDDALRKVFSEMDKNGTGKLDKNELIKAMKEMSCPMTPQEIDDLIQECDKDGDGQINYNEFVSAMGK